MPMDTCYDYLYTREMIPESQLPSVYIKPINHPKKVPRPSVKYIDRPPTSDFSVDASESEDLSPTKKSPNKMQRRDEPIFAPRSLFDRPSPALAKLRRDYKLQKYSNRPVGPPAKATLGPGSISFPIVPPASAKPPPPAPPDMVEWLVAEDSALLQVIRVTSDFVSWLSQHGGSN
jgi:E1A-binding protein p400